MNARWITNPMPHLAFDRLCAVSDDDEILGEVVGSDQDWTASLGATGMLGSGKHARFISQAAAQRRIEAWLAPSYTFPQASANTSWAYKA